MRKLARVPLHDVYWRSAPTPAPGRVLSRQAACPRQALAKAAGRKGDSLAALSALIGRGRGYLDRFVRDGVPRALSERDHRVLADWLGVPTRELSVRELWLPMADAA